MKAFVNGKIWQWAGAPARWMLVADDGEILRVGAGALPAEAEGEGVAVEDLGGRLVLPGLHDAHIHAYGLGESAEYLDLLGCESFEDLAARLAAYDARHPDKAWVVGFGWAQDKLSPSARYPSRHDIDAVIKDRPVILHRGCWHIAVVNTKALEIAGVDVAQKHHEVEGGVIDVDDSGVTGILRESAVEIVMRHANEPSLDLRLKYLKSSLHQCVRFGLTAVHSNDIDGWKLHSKLQEDSGLPLRVFMTPGVDEINSPDVPKPGTRVGRLSCDRVKIFSDGSLGAETAAVRVPYKGTENKGILMHSDADLIKKISEATEKGYRVEIHAIGDRAAEQVLMALREADVPPSKRPIMTHCQILGDDLIKQMRDQGVIGDIQPSFAITDASFARKRLDDHVLKTSYCWKTMLKNGIVCAGGSDAPIETSNPFQGIFDAIYRHKPDQPDSVFLPDEALTFDEALTIYTRNGAYAAMEEHRLGELAPGFRADFVVLNEDVTQNHSALLHQDLVDSVWIDGVVSYQFDRDHVLQPSLQAHDLSASSLPGKNGSIRLCHCCRR